MVNVEASKEGSPVIGKADGAVGKVLIASSRAGRILSGAAAFIAAGGWVWTIAVGRTKDPRPVVRGLQGGGQMVDDCLLRWRLRWPRKLMFLVGGSGGGFFEGAVLGFGGGDAGEGADEGGGSVL